MKKIITLCLFLLIGIISGWFIKEYYDTKYTLNTGRFGPPIYVSGDSNSLEEVLSYAKFEKKRNFDRDSELPKYYVNNLKEFVGALGNDRELIITSPINITKESFELFRMDTIQYLLSKEDFLIGDYNDDFTRPLKTKLELEDKYFSIILKKNALYHNKSYYNNEKLVGVNHNNVSIEIHNTLNLIISSPNKVQFTSESTTAPILSFYKNNNLTINNLTFTREIDKSLNYNYKGLTFLKDKNVLIKDCIITESIDARDLVYLYVEDSKIQNIKNSETTFSLSNVNFTGFNNVTFDNNTTRRSLISNYKDSFVSFTNSSIKNSDRIDNSDLSSIGEKKEVVFFSDSTYIHLDNNKSLN